MLRKYSWILIIIVIFQSCNESKESQESEASPLSSELPDGFHNFYDTFHSDSTFQMSHIVFPLKGERTKIDTMEQVSFEVEHLEAEWKMHKPFAQDGGYNRNFQVMGDLVIENIVDNMGLLNIERRWGKVDTTWSLIFYGTTEKSW